MKMQFCGFEAILMIMLRGAVIKRRAHPCRETAVMAAEDVAPGPDPQSVAAAEMAVAAAVKPSVGPSQMLGALASLSLSLLLSGVSTVQWESCHQCFWV